VASGEAEYLVVRAPDGGPIAKGGIDYRAHPGAGTLWQLATRKELQGLGLGTRLIGVAEDRIRRRGVRRATIGVEDDNPRAAALYRRLGYWPSGREHDSWEDEDEHGIVHLHETELTLLETPL